jgi:hypothetical protein
MAGLVKTMTGQQILAPARPASPSAQTPQVVQLVVGKAEKADASMDGLQFDSSVIGSIAWPVVVLTFLVLFRASIRKLIGRLRKASIAGNSIDLSLDDGDAQMEVLEAIAPPSRSERAANAGMAFDEMPPALTPEGAKRDKDLADLERAPLEPAEVVERIWRLVEQAVRQAAQRKGMTATEINKPVFILGKHMKGQEVFTSQLMGMLAELRKVRNLAVHGEEVTHEASRRYFLLAVRFINLLDGI